MYALIRFLLDWHLTRKYMTNKVASLLLSIFLHFVCMLKRYNLGLISTRSVINLSLISFRFFSQLSVVNSPKSLRSFCKALVVKYSKKRKTSYRLTQLA